MDQGLSQLTNNLIIDDKYIKNSLLPHKSYIMINPAKCELFRQLFQAHLKAIRTLKKEKYREVETLSDSTIKPPTTK